MAQARYADKSIIVSGNVAGTVYRRGQATTILQCTPRRITNQHTVRKQRNKAFRRASNFCGDIQRAGKIPLWRNYATTHPVTNRLGDSRTLTWRHWAIKFNTIRYFNQLNPIIDPPDD